MTQDRLNNLIAAYGPAPANWPEDERAEAIEALAVRGGQVSPEDAALESFLSSATAITPAPGLISKLMPPPARENTPIGLWTRFQNILLPGGRAWPAGIALASLCIGLFTGYSAPIAQPQTDAPEAFLMTAFDSEPLFSALEEETQ